MKYNISEILSESNNYLKKNNISTAQLDSEILLSNIIKRSREDLIINQNDQIEEKNFLKFKYLINRRINGEPIAYLINKKDFWKSTFYVNKNVLIPRPDTEILIEEILQTYSKAKSLFILDIGTGSGCIILTLLKERRNFKGIGIDISKKALNVAKFNAKIHHLENRVKFLKTSVDNFFKGKYDLIVSNPPYINKSDFKYLERDIYEYEPFEALNGGNDGLLIIRRVIKRSSKLLKKNGKLVLEIGYDQRFKVENLLKNEEFYVNKVIKDLGNKNRCIVCTKK